MANISVELEQRLRSMPSNRVDLIVRANQDVTPHLDWLAAAGFEVRHQYKLSPGVAVSATGADALQLLDQAWVNSIELDDVVKAL